MWKESDREAERGDEASAKAVGMGTAMQEMESTPGDRLDVGSDGVGGVIQCQVSLPILWNAGEETGPLHHVPAPIALLHPGPNPALAQVQTGPAHGHPSHTTTILGA